MGSCVSKKAARAGAAREGKVAAPLPPAKEHALSPVVEEEEVVEEVKEVVLSETPAPRQPRSPPEPVKKRQELSEEETEEACSGSECASVGSVAKEKVMAKAKAGGGGDEQEEEVVKRAVVDAPERARRTAAPDQESKPKPKQNGRARSPSPSSAHRRQQQNLQAPPPPAPSSRPRMEPAVVSGFGCRSGRFSPSAARRAAESAVLRSHSAREADMSLPAKRCLAAGVNGHGGSNAGALISRRDVGERSGRRSEFPTASKRPSPAPSPVHRQAGGATRRAAPRENMGSTPERSRPRVRVDVGPDAGRGGDEQPAALAGGVPGERKKAEEGALGQNPSVAMECFIFL